MAGVVKDLASETHQSPSRPTEKHRSMPRTGHLQAVERTTANIAPLELGTHDTHTMTNMNTIRGKRTPQPILC